MRRTRGATSSHLLARSMAKLVLGTRARGMFEIGTSSNRIRSVGRREDLLRRCTCRRSRCLSGTGSIGFMGGGQMTEAIVRSVLSNGSMDPGVVWVHDRNEGRKEIFRGMGVRVPEQGCREMVEACDSVVLSVKPQVVDDALEEMDGLLEGNKLLFSVVAGLEISKLEEKFPRTRIVRLMPNTPVSVGAGVVGYSTGRSALERDVKLTEEIFSASGMVVRLKEQQLDALTGLSGSGPAYLFLALEALADGGVAEGLPRQVALRIAAQTMKGAAEMVLQGDGTDPNMHPAVLKDRVASPAGTTIEGLHALEREGVRTAFFQAVRSSANKSRALRGV